MLGLFKKAAPDRNANDAPLQPDVFYLNNGTGVALVPWSDNIAAEQAMSHPIVYRALDKLATSVQQVGFTVKVDPEAPNEDTTGKVRVIQELQQLLNNPNDNMTPAMLRYWMGLNYAVYGRVPFKVGFSGVAKNRINGVWPLRARHVTVELNDRGTPTKYTYGHNNSGERKETYTSREAHVEGSGTSYVDQIWKPALSGFQDKHEQNTPMRSVGLPSRVIRSLLVRAIQTAEGHPNVRYLVTCDKTLTEPQKKALKRHLNEDHGVEGPSAGKVPILQNAGNIVIHTLDNDLSDIHTKTPSDDMARLIFGAFGIPIALAGIGAADAAKFAGNYDGSRRAFWQDTVIPSYVNPIFQGLTKSLCPRGVVIVPNYDWVPAIAEYRTQSMKATAAINFLTTTEKRAMHGLEQTSELPEQLGAGSTAPNPPEAPTDV